MKKKILKKIISLVLSFLLFFDPLAVGVVWGQDAGSEDNQTEDSQILETSSPDLNQITTEENSGDSNIETGDASSTAEVDTTLNINNDVVPGDIDSSEASCSPPEGETSCPNNINVSNENQAEVEDLASSDSTTGDNSIIGAEGDASIESGDATALGTIDVMVNINSLEFEEEDGLEDGGQISEDEGEEDEGIAVDVDNENQADVENSLKANAQTGENLSLENEGNSTITTGDAQALANLVNLLNFNVVASDFQIEVSNFENGLEEDIDFNEIWRQILENAGFDRFRIDKDGNINVFNVENQNNANLKNDVSVTSSTGENTSSSNTGDSAIKTGDAFSLANVVNLVNINLFGSDFYLGIFNIFRLFKGNLIIPRPDLIVDTINETVSQTQEDEGTGSNGNYVLFENENEAEIKDNVVASSSTGDNSSLNNKNDLISTGNAQSQANSMSFLNINLFKNNWFFLMINSLGKRTGKILGWLYPDSVSEAQSGESLIYNQVGFPNEEFESNLDSQLIEEIEEEVFFRNKNKVNLEDNILASSNTGSNSSSLNSGDSSITTGNAMSLANLFNLLDLNILGSRWFMGVVNVLGDWQGDTIVAYPDVAVDISAGSERLEVGKVIEYRINYQNEGYDVAKNVFVGLTLADGLTYVSDTSGVTPINDGKNLSWLIGDLEKGETGSFFVFAKVNLNVFEQNETSFLPKIVKEVYAQGSNQEVVIVSNVMIDTIDPESDLKNNSSSASTTVYKGEDLPDTRLPIIEISARNNVNDYVYPGDVVAFEVKIKNVGDVEARNAYFVQTLHNGMPEDFGKATIELGTLKPNQEGTLTFGIALSNGHILPEGSYHTEAYVVGTTPSGVEVYSNTARTDFRIVYRLASVIPEAKAEEEVLAANDIACETPAAKEDILPFVFLLLMSSMYLTRWGRTKLALYKNEEKD